METVLSYLLSFSDLIEEMVTWGLDHPAAGMLFTSLLIDFAYRFLPAHGWGRSAFDVVIGAIQKSYIRRAK